MGFLIVVKIGFAAAAGHLEGPENKQGLSAVLPLSKDDLNWPNSSKVMTF